MRDIVLTALVFGSLPFICIRPHVGVVMYVWLSVMNPHRLTWGFAYDMSFASIVGAATLLAVPFAKDLKWPPADPIIVALIAFLAWTGVTTFLALHPGESYARWETLMKTGVMALLIPMLFHTRENLRLLTWVIVISIAYYSVKGGIFTLVTGGAGKVWGPGGSYIEDNNALAVAILMIIPLMRYLQLTTPHRWVAWLLLGMTAFSIISVLGTYSRGALLAMIVMGCVFWAKGRHKLAVLLIALLILPMGFAAMPERWYDRMETIKTYDQEGSASMRLNAWGTAWNLAKDRPLNGGGFVVATPEVYRRYSPDSSFPPQVAHSIYFQALGEHGFVGLGLYLVLLAALWWSSRRVIRISSKDVSGSLGWARDFGLMMQVCVAAYAVGGAFLSLVNFDVPYYLMAIMAATNALVRRQAAAPASRSSQVSPSVLNRTFESR